MARGLESPLQQPTSSALVGDEVVVMMQSLGSSVSIQLQPLDSLLTSSLALALVVGLVEQALALDVVALCTQSSTSGFQ